MINFCGKIVICQLFAFLKTIKSSFNLYAPIAYQKHCESYQLFKFQQPLDIWLIDQKFRQLYYSYILRLCITNSVTRFCQQKTNFKSTKASVNLHNYDLWNLGCYKYCSLYSSVAKCFGLLLMVFINRRLILKQPK